METESMGPADERRWASQDATQAVARRRRPARGKPDRRAVEELSGPRLAAIVEGIDALHAEVVELDRRGLSPELRQDLLGELSTLRTRLGWTMDVLRGHR